MSFRDLTGSHERRPLPEGIVSALLLLALLVAAELSGWQLPLPPDLHLLGPRSLAVDALNVGPPTPATVPATHLKKQQK